MWQVIGNGRGRYRAAPERDVAVDENVIGDSGDKLSLSCRGIPFSSATETVCWLKGRRTRFRAVQTVDVRNSRR